MPLGEVEAAGHGGAAVGVDGEAGARVESKVPSELEQLLVEQTSKVTLPVSWVSGSMNVAVSVGVAVLSRAVSAGLTSVGVDGAAFVVLLVIEALASVAVAAGLPVASAVSRTIGLLPGFV